MNGLDRLDYSAEERAIFVSGISGGVRTAQCYELSNPRFLVSILLGEGDEYLLNDAVELSITRGDKIFCPKMKDNGACEKLGGAECPFPKMVRRVMTPDAG